MDGFAPHLGRRITKDLLRRGIELHDILIPINDDNGIHRGFDDAGLDHGIAQTFPVQADFLA